MLEQSHAHSNERLILKQASEDLCGITTSELQSLTTTHLTMQVLAVTQAECFMNAILIMSQI